MTAKLKLLLLLLAASMPVFAGQQNPDSVQAARKSIIRLVVARLERDHYSPKELDDAYSKAVWKRFITAIDDYRSLFLQKDITRLQAYETTLDDELRQGDVQFFNVAFPLYQQRVRDMIRITDSILQQPVSFKSNEQVLLNRHEAAFPVNEKDRASIWAKRLTYEVFRKIQESAATDSIGKLPLAHQEQLARAKVQRWFQRSFSNLLVAAAEDDKFALYVNAVVFEMDPHTAYNPPADARMLQEQMAHRYYGLGMELGIKNDEVFIKRLISGGAALRSGLVQENDNLVQVSSHRGEMVEVAGMPLNDISRLIRGDKGTMVKLVLRKSNGHEAMVTIERGIVNEDETGARSAVIHQQQQKIGYIYLPAFYADFERKDGVHCAEDIAREVRLLQKEQVSAMVMDLRNNPGGSLDEVVKMLGLFLPPGPKVQLRTRDAVSVYNTDSTQPWLYKGPLTVLINENSASAAEIFAAAIQDYHRGIVIGSASSYGKGTAQATLPMGKAGDPDKGIPTQLFGSIALTQHKFYRVSGSSTQLKGVIPDILLPGVTAYRKVQERDNATALAWDTIPRTLYADMHRSEKEQQLIMDGNNLWKNDKVFTGILENTNWMKQHQDDPVPLSFDKFKLHQQQVQAHLDTLGEIWKLPAGKQLTLTGTTILTDKILQERYEKWMASTGEDAYLLKTVEIMQQMDGLQ
ncbi:MAG: carboxy terminal-processing peptidase [Chitinophaga sp.]|uniref:carboxy terminal-processing peptidase n=1 Tax=Chitinophaga sp. TaxID=1869181 RepID=UPI001B113C4A|nr:carboxy terminal-processing peptidase [Chitinophaga sp.]MBO9730633.1 carboxy terminal-processing peptidase [Chitinophaga sp.]